MKLKLYVWHGSLTDYTAGIMFALAYSAKQAREQILRECSTPSVERDLRARPTVYRSRMACVVFGGG